MYLETTFDDDMFIPWPWHNLCHWDDLRMEGNLKFTSIIL